MSRPRFARRIRGRRALTLAFAPRLIIPLSGACQILYFHEPGSAQHRRGQFPRRHDVYGSQRTADNRHSTQAGPRSRRSSQSWRVAVGCSFQCATIWRRFFQDSQIFRSRASRRLLLRLGPPRFEKAFPHPHFCTSIHHASCLNTFIAQVLGNNDGLALLVLRVTDVTDTCELHIFLLLS